MPEVLINGRSVSVADGVTVAAAVWNSGAAGFRVSVTGEPRAPLCGMGVCYECRLTIDGEVHARSCQTFCRDGMIIETE